MSKGWDNAMLKKLKALTGKGLSTAEIGKKLGMSKNAVVGKLNRLGWNSKAGGAPVEEDKKSTPAVKETKKNAVTATTTKKAPAKKPVAPAKKEPVKKAESAKKASAKPGFEENKKMPAPRVVSSKTSNKTLAMHQRIIQHSLEMANLKPNQCRWPIGDPDSEHFHFCGEQVFVGKPYCYEHCKQAYQFTPPKKK